MYKPSPFGIRDFVRPKYLSPFGSRIVVTDALTLLSDLGNLVGLVSLTALLNLVASVSRRCNEGSWRLWLKGIVRSDKSTDCEYVGLIKLNEKNTKTISHLWGRVALWGSSRTKLWVVYFITKLAELKKYTNWKINESQSSNYSFAKSHKPIDLSMELGINYWNNLSVLFCTKKMRIHQSKSVATKKFKSVGWLKIGAS